jgi:HEAT repeat protein
VTTGRRERKDAARRLVQAFDLDGVERWATGERHAWTTLQPLLFDRDELVRWRAVEAVGRVAGVRAREDVERVRDMLRRTLWLMNDESGGVLWLGPQVVGALLANVPALCGEVLEVLASFLEEDPFRGGTRWALWRVALTRPAAVAAAAADALAASLRDADPAVRGHAALALAAASGPAATAVLADDRAALVVFDPRTGTFIRATVREAASGAL